MTREENLRENPGKHGKSSHSRTSKSSQDHEGARPGNAKNVQHVGDAGDAGVDEIPGDGNRVSFRKSWSVPARKILKGFDMFSSLKATLLTVVGILSTRPLVGLSRFLHNLSFLPVVYLVIAGSGMLALQFSLMHWGTRPFMAPLAPASTGGYSRNPMHAKAIFVAFFTLTVVAMVLGTIHGFVIGQVQFMLITVTSFCTCFPVVFLVLHFLGGDAWTVLVIRSSIRVGGLIFGMLVNGGYLPVHGIFMAAGMFHLSMSKEMVDTIITAISRRDVLGKSTRKMKKTSTSKKSMKIWRIVTFLAIIFLVIPTFMKTWNWLLYVGIVGPGCILLGYLVVKSTRVPVGTKAMLVQLRKRLRTTTALVITGFVVQVII
ncbi:hypothetical protein GF325_15875 [Candidatus Bathyarchaeota archaeon]|nr:hypothetical protein [Candidatus Bathyarchaeota archaeon]